MKLHVRVMEARGLAARDSNGFSDPFVRLQLGTTRARTSVVYRNLNPSWNEEFVFNVVDLDEELSIMVWDEDRFTDDFLGQVRISVSSVLSAEKLTVYRSWFPLRKRNEKSKHPVTGEICLSLSLFGRQPSRQSIETDSVEIPVVLEESMAVSNIAEEQEPLLSRSTSIDSDSSTDASHLVDVPMSPMSPGLKVCSCCSYMHKALIETVGFLLNTDGSEMSSDEDVESIPLSFFDDDGKTVGASPEEIPAPLSGGVVLDQMYSVSAKALNAILFKPGSAFVQDLIASQRSTDYAEEPWRKVGNEPIKRTISYVKAATKLVKAVRATEVQTYTRADDKCFVVSSTCATPDVPYGGNFVVELQISIAAGEDSPTGEKSSRLEISWRLNFLHSTMMKGMIESGARQGIKDSYEIYREVLARHATPILADSLSRTVLTGNQEDERPVSDWQFAWDYLGKFHVLAALLSLMFLLVHIAITPRKQKGGLEFWGLDFPDTLMELVTSSIVVVQVENVVKLVYDVVRARYWQSGDHGVKAQGDGWLTTVTLIEGENIAPSDSGVANPYVVFTCNGETRTSSVKLRTTQPHWGEIFEFNATEDLPSTMDVEVFDYDGPFSEAESLGHAEVNFLKQGPSELADFWISLSGKSALAHGSRLHIRVNLFNTQETDGLPGYIERVEREVGAKVLKRSAQRNSSFQKLFSLPAEEFLINDFACAIKRKIPIQGRLFLSTRLLGFYSNLFGHKTKFTLMWEDIEEIKESAQAINPSIVIFLRRGRAYDARHGARGIDGRGRLKFQFLSFVRSGTAFRTIVALWKNRHLSPQQQMDIIASVEAGDMKYAVAERQADNTQPFLAVEEASMSEVISTEIPITAESVLSVFKNKDLDERVHEKLGLIDYKSTGWENVEQKPGVQRRQESYTLNRQISQFGSKVSCIQQITVTSEDAKKIVIDDMLTLHDVPFGDHFQVQVRREIETMSKNPVSSQEKAFVGVAWHKSTEFQRNITKNVYEHMTKQIQEMTGLIVEEVLANNRSEN
ncbi:unnamed protein product [Sphagnum jensenii]|uniref:C2 and GRAM domain-containing protein n=1 Tax=Sphagnum jensenii TaxID=128206 RepID=A0ABP0XLP2_9BRYO